MGLLRKIGITRFPWEKHYDKLAKKGWAERRERGLFGSYQKRKAMQRAYEVLATEIPNSIAVNMGTVVGRGSDFDIYIKDAKFRTRKGREVIYDIPIYVAAKLSRSLESVSEVKSDKNLTMVTSDVSCRSFTNYNQKTIASIVRKAFTSL